MGIQPARLQDAIALGEGFELDGRTHTLRRGNRAVKLERIPMEILLLLVEHRGQIITRDQIVESVWGKGAFLDTDNSINGAVRKIRQALKDDPEQPRFVQTITGRGYRFIAAAANPGEERPFATPEQQTPADLQPPANEAAAAKPARRRSGLAIALFAGLLALAGAWFLHGRLQASHSYSSARPLLAVLPFENLTGDPAQEYFSDGLTEEMINQLGRLSPQRVGVIARTSVMAYKGSREQLRRIGSELGVQYVLEGSVRRDSDRVRISAQLIRVKDQTQLWAQEYDRELENLLNVQGEIAQEVVDEIQLTLGEERNGPPVRPVRSPPSYEAYDLYLRGLYFWNKRSPEGFQQAVECFERAIAADPKYARAYAGLADSYAMMSDYGLVSADEFMPKARAAALRALELDDHLAEAHTSLAAVAENYDWDWKAAEKEYKRALELNPSYATGHQWYAEMLALQGRFGEALAESERARQLDPLSLIVAADNGAIFYFSRRYDRAIDRFRGIIDMDPGVGRAHLIVDAYVQEGRFKDALLDVERYRRISDGPWIWASKVYVYGRAGDRLRAQHAMLKLQQTLRTWQGDPLQILNVAYAGLDDKDKWLACLQMAYRDHTNLVTSLKVDPIYDPLRDDPRFKDLLRRVGLSD